MLSMAAWKSPGSLHWRGSSSGGPTKILTGLFLGGSLARGNLVGFGLAGVRVFGGFGLAPG